MLLLDTTRQTARAHALKAIRRGDLAAAERWFKLVERYLAVEDRASRIAARDMKLEADEARRLLAEALEEEATWRMQRR